MEEELWELLQKSWPTIQNIILFCANISIAATVIVLIYQHKKDDKTTSITKCKEFLNIIEDDKKLSLTNNLINEKKISMDKKDDIIDLLNVHEDLALYWSEKIICLKHIKEMHGAALWMIKNNDIVKKIMYEPNPENEKRFSKLKNLLKKIN